MNEIVKNLQFVLTRLLILCMILLNLLSKGEYMRKGGVFILSALILISLFSCTKRFTNYTSYTTKKYRPLNNNSKVDVILSGDEVVGEFRKIGLFTVEKGDQEWQIDVTKKFARRRGANVVILKSIRTTVVVTYSEWGVSSTSWVSRTFLLGRYLN